MCLICQFDRMHEKIDTKNEREKRRQQEISNRPNGKTSVQMMKIRNWSFHLKWGNHIKCVFSWIVFSHVRNIIWVLAHGIGQTNESIKCWMNARPALMTNEILHTHRNQGVGNRKYNKDIPFKFLWFWFACRKWITQWREKDAENIKKDTS